MTQKICSQKETSQFAPSKKLCGFENRRFWSTLDWEGVETRTAGGCITVGIRGAQEAGLQPAPPAADGLELARGIGIDWCLAIRCIKALSLGPKFQTALIYLFF